MKARRIKVKDIDIYWDNGRYVAVADDGTGTLRNYALDDARTKALALAEAKWLLGLPLTRREQKLLGY